MSYFIQQASDKLLVACGEVPAPDGWTEVPASTFERIANMFGYRLPETLSEFTLLEVTEEGLQQAKEPLLEAVYAGYEQALLGGVQVEGNWYHTDLKSRQLYTEKLMFPETLGAGGKWKTLDGTYVEMTLELMYSIAKTASFHVSQCFKLKQAELQRIQELTTLIGFTPSANWPTAHTPL